MNRFKRALPVSLALAFGTAGCTLSPEVQYKIVKNASDMNGMDEAYSLREPTIIINHTERNKETEGSEERISDTFEIFVEQREYLNHKLAFEPKSNIASQTNIELNKIENTDLVQSVDIETTSIVAQYITEFGGPVVKLITTFGLGVAEEPPCMKKGESIKIPITEDDLKSGTVQTGKDCITVDIKDLPPDALEVSALPQNQYADRFYYASCREAEVEVEQYDGRPVHKILRISDPRYVQFARLPSKGTITMHSGCGATIRSEGDGQTGGGAILEALAVQGKAIKDALTAAKPDDKGDDAKGSSAE